MASQKPEEKTVSRKSLCLVVSEMAGNLCKIRTEVGVRHGDMEVVVTVPGGFSGAV